ncbi:MAG: hypothetical protein OEY78_12465, partial [Gammaproteobacteria bacterium]|nr:hypothetical protein [Gammaproteobacteria bacterium]
MDISRFIPFLKKSKKTEKIVKKSFLFSLHEKLPRLSFGLSVFVALFGILFLLMFPLLLISMPFELYDTVIHAKEINDWIDASIQLVIIGLAAAFSWAIYRLKFHLPTGLDVTEEKFPHLYKLIEELRDEFGQPKIDRIIIRDNYEIRVLKTPRDGLPFLNKSTLIIGLPVFLTMSPLYFRALMARRIGQLSTKHTPITTRLYFLTDTWLQFTSSAKHSKNLFARALNYYFVLYTRIYKAVLLPLLQEEELEADSYGLDIVNESDMAECIVYEEALLTFLKTKFWPKIYHMARRTKTPEFMPYSQMSKVV